MMRRKTVTIKVGQSFYDILEKRRQALQKKVGYKKNITQTNFTELLAKKGIKFPKININIPKNVKRKKR